MRSAGLMPGESTTSNAFSWKVASRASISAETRVSTTNTGGTAAAACACSRRSVDSSFSTRKS